MDLDSHEGMICLVIIAQFQQVPKLIQRIKMGICNEVYLVRLSQKEVIIRLSPHDHFLMGSHDHIPKFKALQIVVPDILAEDYEKKLIPLSYQVLSKIEGNDLGQVIDTLSDHELKELAKEIAHIFHKVSRIPSSDKCGVIFGGGSQEMSKTWAERIQIWIEEARERGVSTGIMDATLQELAENLYRRYQSYFASITPVTYYGDICSKNVMIHRGLFSGLVDLDVLAQGDPLEAVGRIFLSWYGTHHGNVYSTAVMNELGLNKGQREFVKMYALLNQISWACENGIQFNQNTRAIVDERKKYRDKVLITELAEELGVVKNH